MVGEPVFVVHLADGDLTVPCKLPEDEYEFCIIDILATHSSHENLIGVGQLGQTSRVYAPYLSRILGFVVPMERLNVLTHNFVRVLGLSGDCERFVVTHTCYATRTQVFPVGARFLAPVRLSCLLVSVQKLD